MPIKNYTTEVDEGKTVGEITGLLASKGARAIRIDYDDRCRPRGVAFVLSVLDTPIPFQLPCDFDGVFKALGAQYKDRYARAQWERRPESMNQARRVAWRIIKNWIEAQIAIVEAGQASMVQIFMPYAQTSEGGITMYDRFLNQISSQKSLPAPEVQP